MSDTNATREDPVVQEQELRAICAETLQAAGLSPQDAMLTADTLVQSEMEGAASHGLIRLPLLSGRLKAGLINAQTEIEVVRETSSTALIDGHNSIGQVVAARAMELAMAKARQTGTGAVAVRESNHLGRAGHPAALAADVGLIGYCASNSSPRVVADVGASPVLGNNPWSFAFPTEDGPLVIDMANSVVAAGKIRVKEKKGERIPAHWALDAEGQPTEDPTAALGGALMAFGGYKGWAVSLVVDVLAGVLSGGAFAGETGVVDDRTRKQRSSHFFLALDPDSFIPHVEFVARMAELRRRLEEAAGPGGRLPGDRSRRLLQKHREEGLPLRPAALNAIRQARRELDLPPWEPST